MPGPFTMAQQAQNDYYTSTEDLALGYAEAVNEEVADLFTAGADIVQLDEPYLQARPDEARKYGVRVINRALEGITGTTAVHLCFGYAAIIHERPSGYSFLPELAECVCDQVSIETAQSGLDCEILTGLDGKTIILGVLNLGDETVETPAEIVARARRALAYVPAERIVLAPDCGMKYLPRDAAFGKLVSLRMAAALLRADAASPRLPDPSTGYSQPMIVPRMRVWHPSGVGSTDLRGAWAYGIRGCLHHRRHGAWPAPDRAQPAVPAISR